MTDEALSSENISIENEPDTLMPVAAHNDFADDPYGN
jgi:hypothetical protein